MAQLNQSKKLNLGSETSTENLMFKPEPLSQTTPSLQLKPTKCTPGTGSTIHTLRQSGSNPEKAFSPDSASKNDNKPEAEVLNGSTANCSIQRMNSGISQAKVLNKPPERVLSPIREFKKNKEVFHLSELSQSDSDSDSESESASCDDEDSSCDSDSSSSMSEHTISDHRSRKQFTDDQDLEIRSIYYEPWSRPKFMFGSLENLSSKGDLIDPYLFEEDRTFEDLKKCFDRFNRHKQLQKKEAQETTPKAIKRVSTQHYQFSKESSKVDKSERLQDSMNCLTTAAPSAESSNPRKLLLTHSRSRSIGELPSVPGISVTAF